MMTSPPPSGEVLPVSKVRQWAVLPDGLLLSTRAPDGSWIPVRRLGYDDLRLVYRFEVVDWGPLGWASFIWLLVGTLTLAGLLLAKMGAEWVFLIVFIELVAILGAAVYMCQTRLKPMLRFEAYSGELVLPESNPRFFASVSEALAAAETWRQSAPAPEALGYPGAEAQQQWQPYAGLPPLWTPPPSAAEPTAAFTPPPAEWTSPPPPPPDYSAPSVQSAENPPSPAGDSAEATGENERR